MRESVIPALVPADPAANATDLLIERAALTPDQVLFGIPEGDGWRDVTAAEFLAQVRALAKGFVAAGVQPGDKIGIMSRTRYEWVLTDFAMWFAGGIL
ncbi:MAG: AMP-binding protein, partial [Microbacteriaceae bacterium]|nr:AMP-binding protein [Microbacteriaceae bacterium]